MKKESKLKKINYEIPRLISMLENRKTADGAYCEIGSSNLEACYDGYNAGGIECNNGYGYSK